MAIKTNVKDRIGSCGLRVEGIRVTMSNSVPDAVVTLSKVGT